MEKEMKDIQRQLGKVSDVDQLSSTGSPPLIYAVKKNKMEAFDLLLEHKADINVLDKSGLSPLDHALLSSEDYSDEMTRCLLARGAKFESKALEMKSLGLTKQYWLTRALEIGPIVPREVELLEDCGLSRIRELNFAVVGQRLASHLVYDKLVDYRSKKRQKPLVLLFAGPPGHGKTFLAERMAKAIAQEQIKIACEKYSTKMEMFGARDPYVGSRDGSLLNNFLCRPGNKPRVVIFDEFEKTTRDIQEGCLNLFEKGDFEDNRNRTTVQITSTIFVLTTNALDDLITAFFSRPENAQRLKSAKQPKDYASLGKLAEDHCKASMKRNFSAAMSRRINAVIPFVPFIPEVETSVLADIQLRHMCTTARKPKKKGEKNYPPLALTFTPELVHQTATSYLPSEGVSSIEHAVDSVHQFVIREFSQGRLDPIAAKSGQVEPVWLHYSNSHNFVISKTKPVPITIGGDAGPLFDHSSGSSSASDEDLDVDIDLH